METTLLFASDFHGSDKVYRKFLNAGKIYKPNFLIAGGDLTGKAIIPIVKRPDGSYSVRYKGEDLRIRSSEELLHIETNITSSGYYPYETTPEEMEKMDDGKVHELFTLLMKKRIESWVKLAEDRLRGIAEVYLLPGNDDTLGIDAAIDASNFVKNPEGKVTTLGTYPMIATGYSNMTPWKAPRDIPEEQLSEKIEQMFGKVEDTKSCIFVSHVPPFASGLDFAPKLGADLKPAISGGGAINEPVGSKSVKKAIETYQPLLCLSGHIHESPGLITIGRTVCINAGSEYETGVLKAALVTLRKEGSNVEVNNKFIAG